MDSTAGHRLKVWRTHFGKTVAECAEAMGVHKSGLSRIENDLQRVTSDQIEAFALFVGMTMVDFYGPLPTSDNKTAAANG